MTSGEDEQQGGRVSLQRLPGSPPLLPHCFFMEDFCNCQKGTEMEYFPCSLAEMYLSFGGSFPALKINNTHVYALRQRTDKEIAIVSTSYLEEWPETGPLKDIRLSSIQIRAASLMCCHHF